MHDNCSRKKPRNVLLMATVKVVGKRGHASTTEWSCPGDTSPALCPERVLEAAPLQADGKHGNYVS